MIDAGLSELRPTRAEISLDALAANLQAIRDRVAGRPILGVVKANAYGHGAVTVARFLQEAGVEQLAVALLEEAVELRRVGIVCPLLVMGALEPSQMDSLIRAEATPALFREDQLQALESAASRLGRKLPFHLKLDTGMGRLGVPSDRIDSILDLLDRSPHLDLQGLMSHLACADDPDHPLTRVQIERFEEALERTRRRGRQPALLHLANSAAVLDRPPAWLNLVRPGLLLYGYRPSPRNQDLPLRPVMRVATRIVYLKEVPPGESVGYGATFTATRPSRIATLAAGYDDGIRRSLSNLGHFLVRGERVPIVGRVSMDLTTLDVTDYPWVALGDEAVFIGEQEGAFQGADQVAEEAGTISWEILCGIGGRVPRVYLREGKVVGIQSRFHTPS